MMSREAATREALSELEAQRAGNYAEEHRRRQEVSEKSPKAASLLLERSALLSQSISDAFARPEEAVAISASLSKRLSEIGESLRSELRVLGLPDDYLQPVYRCPICRDTGYVGELLREPCVCLKNVLLKKFSAVEGLQGLAGQNFDTFDGSVFPDELQPGQKLTQRETMLKVRALCERFAEDFLPGEGRGLLLYGETGVGKTFLLNCVAQRVLARGFSVAFVGAYRMSEIMRQNQFDGSNADLVNEFLTCDLLCVDDLGSEPMRRETTVSGFYYILNERTNAGKAFAVSTNCTPQQLYARYGDRVAARLCDPGRMQVFHLTGVDVRRRAAQLKE
ncbi:MAG: ATP-binding protein [Clostridiales bacterium]|nr:ATP-binding protein [Clostridiales bacterium]